MSSTIVRFELMLWPCPTEPNLAIAAAQQPIPHLAVKTLLNTRVIPLYSKKEYFILRSLYDAAPDVAIARP